MSRCSPERTPNCRPDVPGQTNCRCDAGSSTPSRKRSADIPGFFGRPSCSPSLARFFGGAAVAFDPDAKAAIAPFPHLLQNPAERVKEEESKTNPILASSKSRFSAALITNNTKVSILALALGVTWGIGTLILLFYNGVVLGAVIFDYVRAGQSVFLMGWLLPHGVIEIPAILIAGQAGLLLGQALIGWNSKENIDQRLRSVTGSLVTLISGAALLLIWAGMVEAFFSQYHEPILPYQFKIVFGLVELIALLAFQCSRAGESELSLRIARAASENRVNVPLSLLYQS